MHTTLKTPHYRIDDPQTGLAVHFRCEAAPAAIAPKVFAQLVEPAYATIFHARATAEACFAQWLCGQALDIVRVDE